MKKNGKFFEILKNTIGENNWTVIAGFSAVAVLGAASLLPQALAIIVNGPDGP